MPRIKQLHFKANDLYWQIEDWRIDYDIPEVRIDDALRAAARLDEELTELYKDVELRRLEAMAAGEIDGDSTPLATSSAP